MEQTTVGESDDKLLRRGIELLWNTKFNQAEEIFATRAKEDLWFCLYYTQVQILRTTISDSDYEEAFKRVTELDQMAEYLYNQHNKPLLSTLKSFVWSESSKTEIETHEISLGLKLKSELVLAECAGLHAMLFFKKQNFVKGAYYIRKCWKYYQSAKAQLNAHPEKFDSNLIGLTQLGVGLFHFAVSLVPPTFLWMVEALGFEANREIAFEELKSSSQSNCYRSTEATLSLAAIYWFVMDNKQESQKLVDEIIANYGSSAFLKSLKAGICKYEGEIAKSIFYYSEAMNECAEIPQLTLVYDYELADCYWKLCHWDKAIPGIENYLSNSTSKNFKAFGSYKLGFCYWSTGQRDKIEELYKKIPSLVMKGKGWDGYAERKSERWLFTQKFSSFEEVLVKAQNFIEAHQFKSGLAELNKMPALLQSDYDGLAPLNDCIGLFRYMKGLLYKTAKRYPKAKPHFEKVISIESSLVEEKWIVPFSYMHIGGMALDQGDLVVAEKMFAAVKGFPPGYDFERSVGVWVAAEIAKLKQKKSQIQK